MSEQQTQTNTLPTIAIVGRPNVGKSSLFNSILKKRQAIVHFDSGVTRDRVSSTGVANGRRFRLVDTGGLGMGKVKSAESISGINPLKNRSKSPLPTPMSSSSSSMSPAV